MIRSIAGAIALAASSPLLGQSGGPDLTYAVPIAGSWHYAPSASGSEANFATPAAALQLTIRCTRQSRRVTISKPAPAASASLRVWTSLQSRSMPAVYDSAAARMSADLSAFDAFLDAMASSGGRLGITTPGAAPLVVPSGGEVARVVEDCRV